MTEVFKVSVFFYKVWRIQITQCSGILNTHTTELGVYVYTVNFNYSYIPLRIFTIQKSRWTTRISSQEKYVSISNDDEISQETLV